MSKLKIFVSSNQKEFEHARLSIKQFIENTPIYSNLFEVFIFENRVAEGRSPDEIYLKEVEESDIFLGLIGKNYGEIHENGLSASEEEFDIFLKSSNIKNTFVYILENINPDKNTEKFIKKAHIVKYDRFNHENLLMKIQRSLEKFLYMKGILQNKDFDERFVLESSYEDVDEEKVKYFLKISDSITKIGGIDKEIKNTLLNRLSVLNHDLNLNNTGILFFSKKVEKFLS
ncbi:MAG: DUF4062 domain-containing protein [Methanobrevibacter sp.]|jgi:hypothetical protein|nr:DUF4062 domain-containing protein [Candidatus Methanovirga meridionalis]